MTITVYSSTNKKMISEETLTICTFYISSEWDKLPKI